MTYCPYCGEALTERQALSHVCEDMLAAYRDGVEDVLT